jgi:hypothetical protein
MFNRSCREDEVVVRWADFAGNNGEKIFRITCHGCLPFFSPSINGCSDDPAVYSQTENLYVPSRSKPFQFLLISYCEASMFAYSCTTSSSIARRYLDRLSLTQSIRLLRIIPTLRLSFQRERKMSLSNSNYHSDFSIARRRSF